MTTTLIDTRPATDGYLSTVSMSLSHGLAGTFTLDPPLEVFAGERIGFRFGGTNDSTSATISVWVPFRPTDTRLQRLGAWIDETLLVSRFFYRDGLLDWRYRLQRLLSRLSQRLSPETMTIRTERKLDLGAPA